MRFINNLLPQLTKAGAMYEDSGPAKPGLRRNLASVVSVLEAGGESPINLDDLSLKTTYSLKNAAKHAITMTSLSMQELAASHPEVSFVHAYPGLVKTGFMREFGTVTRIAMNAMLVLAKPWLVPLNESGDRHLYAATSPRFPPRASTGGNDVAPGADGSKGSGSYLLHWDGSIAGNQVLQDYRKNETGKLVWEHTVGVFESVCSKDGVSQD
jgi:NAD(P)-dependent dehydrogenase (short-subunit alcohol dehydrogenase family)